MQLLQSFWAPVPPACTAPAWAVADKLPSPVLPSTQDHRQLPPGLPAAAGAPEVHDRRPSLQQDVMSLEAGHHRVQAAPQSLLCLRLATAIHHCKHNTNDLQKDGGESGREPLPRTTTTPKPFLRRPQDPGQFHSISAFPVWLRFSQLPAQVTNRHGRKQTPSPPPCSPTSLTPDVPPARHKALSGAPPSAVPEGSCSSPTAARPGVRGQDVLFCILTLQIQPPPCHHVALPMKGTPWSRASQPFETKRSRLPWAPCAGLGSEAP